ncbi:MAG: hemin uptake protein HemP [Burkholderiales bacterium]
MSFEPRQHVLSNQKLEAKASFPAERIVSHRLLGQRGELIIEHNGREYRLRLTQSGKLILTA